MTRMISWATIALVVTAGPIAGQEHAGQYARADVEYGLRLYGTHCVSCHGDNGDAVPDVDLRSGQVSSDRELARIIRDGLPDTAMMPGEYSASELTALVAYLRTMGDFEPGTVTLGDASRGSVIFEGKGECSRCHRVDGNGPRVAPDLSDIGARRTAGLLQRSLLDPTGAMLPVNRPVRAVTRDGTVYRGRRLNEDTYTVQLIDEQERLVSLEKVDLREYSVIETSPMPSYADRLSAQERADLLAYLLSLKGMD
ncbi:c-type cytochrome [Acidobacteria bacterium AH-259-L09]|nr:c-type cytochrome [Acidobacteria bacterium AH-259-L09]